MTQRLTTLLFIGSLLIAASCSKKDEAEENSNELITTIELKVTEQGTNNTMSFEFEDLDGPGGQAPEIDLISLEANKVYNVKMEIYDKSKSPAVEIDEEVEEEGASHRIYIEPSSGSNIVVSNLDNDNTGKPLGLNSVWTTSGDGTGTVKITLRHYENGGKEASDPVNSTKSNTDAEVVFNVAVSN